jgi:Ca2+-transporting ATPase
VATQLLFVNLLTDAFPGFALAMEGKEPGIMNRKPRNPKETIINRRMMKSVVVRSTFIAFGALMAFLYGLFGAVAPEGVDQHVLAMSICFFTLVACELLAVYPAKSDAFIGMSQGMFRNKFLNIATLISFVILFSALYVPVLSDLFTVVPLSAIQISVSLVLVFVTVAGFEISKLTFKG